MTLFFQCFFFLVWSQIVVRNCAVAAHRSPIPIFQTGGYRPAAIHSEPTLLAVIAPSAITTRPPRQDENNLAFDDERDLALRAAHYTVV